MGYTRIVFVLVAAATMMVTPHASAQQATVTVVIEGPVQAQPEPTPEPTPAPVRYVDHIDAPAPEPMQPASSHDPNVQAIVAMIVLAGLLLGAAIPIPRRKRVRVRR